LRKDLNVLFFQIRTNKEVLRTELDCFLERSKLRREQVNAVNVVTEEVDLSLLQDVDAVFVGGSGEFYVSDNFPGLHKLKDVIKRIVEYDTPFFGMCFGMQLLVSAAGGRVGKVKSMSELGTFSVRLNGRAASDPIFSTLSGTFLAHQGHNDSVLELPPDSVVLAEGDVCKIQAIRLGKNVYGTQFHPELDVDEMTRRLNAYWQGFGKADAMEEVFGSLKETEEAHSILSTFVDKVVNKEV
jgi:GMP synthase (glutamine-hydrolysing)